MSKRTPENQVIAVRDQIFALHDQGKDATAIARSLKIKATTVAAYLAHRTRGTYDV